MAKSVPANLKLINTKSLIRNLTVAGICILGMGASLLVFRKDMDNSARKQLNRVPVGTVYWLENTSQRLSAGHNQWNRLERFSSIYNGDTISSVLSSKAKISFVNGEILELSDKTSVSILYNEETSVIKLLAGDIQVQSGRNNLVVSLAGNEPETTASLSYKAELNPRTSLGIIASSEAGGAYTFKVYQGSCDLTSGSFFRHLGPGQALRTEISNNTGEDLPLFVLAPRNDSRILTSSRGKTPVNFQWQRANHEDINDIVLEIAEHKDFSHLTGTWHTDNSDSLSIDLSEGSYYWRVFVPPATQELDSGKLEIVYTPPSRALSPADSSIQTITAGKNDLHFYWVVPQEVEAIMLEVADNQEMSRPRLRHLIRRASGYGSYSSSEIGVGKWYWRVHPVLPGEVAESDSLLSQMRTGQDFWRVRPLSTDMLSDVQPSSVNSFTVIEDSGTAARTNDGSDYTINVIAGYSPRTAFPPDNYALEAGRTPDILFSWRNPLSYEARFQIAERSDFTGNFIMDEHVWGSNMRSIYLKPGTYYWRVTGDGPAGTSETIPVRLVVEPSLIAPELRTPAENENLHIETGKPVVFSWAKPFYADYFLFRLFLEGRSVPLAEISSLENTSILVSFDPTTTGRFRWTVQGFTSPGGSSNGRSGLIAQGHFSIPSKPGSTWNNEVAWSIPRIENIEIKHGDLFSPITLRSPGSGINIQGMTALHSSLEARWTTNEPIRNAQLIVSSTPNPSTDPRAIVIDATVAPVHFPVLREGIWYWTIRGDTIDMRGATAGEIFWFRVLPIPQLPAPRPLSPGKEAVIGIEQLTRDRKITFTWEEVSEANAYIFSLFRLGSSEGALPNLVISTNPEAVLSYVLENLSVLNDGNYYWQVEAVALNESVGIEQRGIIEHNNFTIEIRHSSSMQTQIQGSMYGQ